MAESVEATSYFSRNVKGFLRRRWHLHWASEDTGALQHETQMYKTYLDNTEQNNSEKYVTWKEQQNIEPASC